MADEKKDSNIGEDIGKIVQDAISSVNYEQLGSMISSTVDKALVEAKKGIKKGHAKFAGIGVSRRKQGFLQVS